MQVRQGAASWSCPRLPLQHHCSTPLPDNLLPQLGLANMLYSFLKTKFHHQLQVSQHGIAETIIREEELALPQAEPSVRALISHSAASFQISRLTHTPHVSSHFANEATTARYRTQQWTATMNCDSANLLQDNCHEMYLS